MLVLTRKAGETVVISDGDEEIEIRILKVQGKSISIGVNAPRNMRIYRGELVAPVEEEEPTTQVATLSFH